MNFTNLFVLIVCIKIANNHALLRILNFRKKLPDLVFNFIDGDRIVFSVASNTLAENFPLK